MNKAAPVSLSTRDERCLEVINRNIAEANRILRSLRVERERDEKRCQPARDILAEVKAFVSGR